MKLNGIKIILNQLNHLISVWAYLWFGIQKRKLQMHVSKRWNVQLFNGKKTEKCKFVLLRISLIVFWWHPINSLIWNPPYYLMCAILFPLHNFSWPGFYFPDVTAEDKYYNGSILEEEYEKKLMVSNLRK